ncbi:hypothetical protein [Streptomyces sp. NPDC093261]|uniref:hypothetical protein n=1 Tax=Streptomyces sp. NPDC093261 TaxID=3366037 RepID=UPI0037F49FD6
MITLGKATRLLDLFLDLMGVAVGAALLLVGIHTYREGGSAGWPIAGAALFLANLWMAWRRVARRIRAARPRSG